MALTDYPLNDVGSKKAHVKITKFLDKCKNPEPVSENYFNSSEDNRLTEELLREITGSDDLTSVFMLEFQLDVRKTTLRDLGYCLPNLKHLKLSSSYVPSIRDLGTNLTNIEVLFMPHCRLECLDGISSLRNLVELYIAFNGISDLSPCAMLESIEVLDLEGNAIEEKSNLTYLRLCKKLGNLTLEGNPIVMKYGGPVKYRKIVRKQIPQITVLDDIGINSNPVSNSISCVVKQFDDEWNYIDVLLKEIGSSSFEEVENLQDKRFCNRESPTVLKRYANKIKKLPQRELSSGINLANLTQGLSNPVEVEVLPENHGHLSELTIGKIVCGGISAALRKRKEQSQQINEPKHYVPVDLVQTEPQSIENVNGAKFTISEDKSFRKIDTRHHPPTINRENDLILEEEETLRIECDAVLKELENWRKKYARSWMFKSRKNIPETIKSEFYTRETDMLIITTDSDITLEELSEDSRSEDVSCLQENEHKSTNKLSNKIMENDSLSVYSSSSGYASRITSTDGRKSCKTELYCIKNDNKDCMKSNELSTPIKKLKNTIKTSKRINDSIQPLVETTPKSKQNSLESIDDISYKKSNLNNNISTHFNPRSSFPPIMCSNTGYSANATTQNLLSSGLIFKNDSSNFMNKNR